MAVAITRLLTLSKLHRNFAQTPRLFTGHISSRGLQEFPGLRLDNSSPDDHFLVLPEALTEDASSNELLRTPRMGEQELNMSKLNAEKVFKGFSQTICAFENFITDANNTPPTYNKITDVFKDIEEKLYPMDCAYNILMILLFIDSRKYQHKEIYALIERYMQVRERRTVGVFREALRNLSQNRTSLSDADEKLLRIYITRNRRHPSRTMTNLDESSLFILKENLDKDLNQFLACLSQANSLFSHTVDDPDILSVVSNEFEDCQDLHHKERTPLKITVATYQRFMRVCPDRFIRQILWSTYNKRCSPKAYPKFNTTVLLMAIQMSRRKTADLLGYRTHLDLRLDGTMAQTRARVQSQLNALNKENQVLMGDRLRELNDYAADNGFEDPDQMGIKEYDLDYWIHKYKHDILIGVDEVKLKTYFPLSSVLDGIQRYFKDYFAIDIKPKPTNQWGQFWSSNLKLFEVSRNGQPLGNIIYDPFQRDSKHRIDDFYARLRSRYPAEDFLPAKVMSTSFKLNKRKGDEEANLSPSNVINLFICYTALIQRFLYKFPHYELNLYGNLEAEAVDLLPNLTLAHILTDHRVIQSCSDRGQSKPIDTELASRTVKALNYFRPLKTWHELYKAQLDVDAHTSVTDARKLANNAYAIYSPFQRDPDNYDFCAMKEIFVGPNDGLQYSDLWSRQMANFCLTHAILDADGKKVDDSKARAFYPKLVDSLFDGQKFDTNEKLTALVGHQFDATTTSLSIP